MSAPTASALHAAAWERLQTLGAITHYEGNPPPDEEIPRVDGDAELVAPYTVLRTSAGRAGDVDGSGEPITLSGDMDGLAGGFRVTVAAGLYMSCLWAVDKVRGAFTRGAPLVVAGVVLGQLTEDTDPGEPQIDRTVKPVRYYVPMRFRLPADRGE